LHLKRGKRLAHKGFGGVGTIRLAEDAAVFKPRDFLPAETDFERYFLRMLAEFGRCAMRAR